MNTCATKKLIFVLLLGVFLISFASATLPPVEQNKCIELRTILNATQVNISTVTHPNQTLIIINSPMSKNGKTFNYTFCDTSVLGEYVYDYYDNQGNTYVNDFDVTADGKERKDFPMQFSFIIFSVLMIIFGLTGERRNIFKTLGGIFMMVMGVITLYPGYGFINWSNLQGLAMGSVLLGLGFYFAIEDIFRTTREMDGEEGFEEEMEEFEE